MSSPESTPWPSTARIIPSISGPSNGVVLCMAMRAGRCLCSARKVLRALPERLRDHVSDSLWRDQRRYLPATVHETPFGVSLPRARLARRQGSGLFEAP
jgi:hypothetical protein